MGTFQRIVIVVLFTVASLSAGCGGGGSEDNPPQECQTQNYGWMAFRNTGADPLTPFLDGSMYSELAPGNVTGDIPFATGATITGEFYLDDLTTIACTGSYVVTANCYRAEFAVYTGC